LTRAQALTRSLGRQFSVATSRCIGNWFSGWPWYWPLFCSDLI
jgi:hypothetical protein